MKRLSFVALSLILTPSLGLFAEESQKILQPRSVLQPAEPAGKPLQIQKPVRKIASINDKGISRVKVRKTHRPAGSHQETDIRLGLFGGLTSISSGDSSVQAFRDEQKLGQNYVVGLNADLRFLTYLGTELDAFYGIAPSQSITVGDNEENWEKKLSHMGGMFELKGQVPFYTGSVRWVPKLGLGYGLLKLNQKTTASQSDGAAASQSVEASESIKGIYGSVGFEVEPVSMLIFAMDYAKSVSASGDFSSNSSDETIGNSDVKLDKPEFDRLRAGLFFRVDPNILIGGQYVKRSMKFSANGQEGGGSASLLDISSSESLSQISAMLLFQF